MSRHFFQLVKKRWQQGSLLCVGLDPHSAKIPQIVKEKASAADEAMLAFNKAIIDATHPFVCAFKPQSAYYEALGAKGLEVLQQTIAYIHQVAPDVPVILDAKRADIDSTNEGYIRFAFEYLHADAITLHPYLGGEALAPFLAREDKGIIILCRTSNPGAGEFQDQQVAMPEETATDTLPLYRYVALRVAHHWNTRGNCLLVVGATYPKEMAEIRNLVGDMPFLVPGIGSQGGDVAATVRAGIDSQREGLIISSSRGIIFASNGSDFAEAAAQEAQRLRDEINQHRGV